MLNEVDPDHVYPCLPEYRPSSKKPTEVAAKKGLELCNQLFAIERDLKEAKSGERYEKRLARSHPVLDVFSHGFRPWIPKSCPKVPLGRRFSIA